MTRLARLLVLAGTLLGLGAVVPAVVVAAGPDAVYDEVKGAEPIEPTVIDALENDRAGAATPTSPLRISSVGRPLDGTAVTDGRSVVYDPSGCFTGVNAFSYTITDGVTSSTDQIVVVVGRPSDAPATDTPVASFRRGSTISRTTPVRISWCAVPARGASLRKHRLYESTNGGLSFASGAIVEGTATTTTRDLATGTSYAWRVRTTDTKGSDRADSPTTKISRFQDTSGSIAYTSGWKRASASGYSGGTERYATREGATATLTVAGVRQFGIVSSTAPGRGRFHVYVDGVRVTSSAISQRSGSADHRKVLYVGSIPGDTAGTHTIRIRTTSRARVDLDAIVTMSARATPDVTFTAPTPAEATYGMAGGEAVATTDAGLPVLLTLPEASWPVCALYQGTLAFHGVGTCAVTATVFGDARFNGRTVTRPITVAKADQVIDFGPRPAAPVKDGEPFTVTAGATSGLPVSFGIDPASDGVCTIEGDVVHFPGSGDCVITADQPGDANWNAAPTASLGFPVASTGTATQAITFSGPDDAVYGDDPVHLEASSDSGLPVALSSQTPAACSVSGTAATILAAGTCTVEARQAGNAAYAPATPVSRSFDVHKAVLDVTATDAQIDFGDPAPSYAFEYGEFQGDDDAGDLATEPSCTSAYLEGAGAGSYPITCAGGSDAQYDFAYHAGTLTVVPAAQAITFGPLPDHAYGDGFVVAAASSSGLPVAFASQSEAVCTVADTTVTVVDTGTCTILATQAGSASYLPAAPVDQAFTATARAITVTAVPDSKPADGDRSSVGVPTVTGGELAAGDTGDFIQAFDTPDAGTGKTLTPSGSVLHGPADVTARYAITWVAVATGTILAGPAAALSVDAASPQVRGAPFTVTVTALDAFGNIASGYTGTVHLTSTAPTFTALDHTFTAPESGIAAIAATIPEAGTFTISATDTIDPALTSTSAPIVVADP